MAVLQSVPEREYVAGDYPFGPLNIQNQVQRARISLTRVNWPDTAGADIIQAQLEVSYDAGQTWPEKYAFTAAGGVVKNRDGSVALTSSLEIPLKAGNQRRLRGQASVFATLTTAINVESV